MKKLLSILLTLLFIHTITYGQMPAKQAPKKPAPGKIVPTVKQPVSNKASYFTIVQENSDNLVAVKDTLYIQLDKSLSFGTEPVSYLIRNVGNSKASPLKKITVVNSGGFAKVAVPLQNSVVGKAGSGMLTIGNAKKYYFVSFKRG